MCTDECPGFGRCSVVLIGMLFYGDSRSGLVGLGGGHICGLCVRGVWEVLGGSLELNCALYSV